MQEKFNILSLSGGGYMGLYTAHVLESLEAKTKRPIARSFDLIAGTSIGGILALAVAAEIPMSKVRCEFEEKGEVIFSGRPAPTGWVAQALDFGRSLTKAKYRASGLHKTLEAVFPAGSKVNDLNHRCIIAAVNASSGSPKVFKTPHHSDFFTDLKFPLAKVALATSAAPTFFPVAEIEGTLYVDGGLYANSPDLLAVHEAEHYLKRSIEDISVLSIGTTKSRQGLSNARNRNMGIWGWMSTQALVQLAMSAQQESVSFIVQHRLGDRYLRLDAALSPDQQADLGLDVATPAARELLKGLAGTTIQANLGKASLQTLLEHSAKSPVFYRGE